MYTQEEIDDNRQKWFEVLRDPGSKKHIGRLEHNSLRPYARCCLGHACHALDIERQEWDKGDLILYGGCETILPQEAADKLGMNAAGQFKKPVIFDGIGFLDLASLNDNSDIGLEEMANVIEEQFKNNNFDAGHRYED